MLFLGTVWVIGMMGCGSKESLNGASPLLVHLQFPQSFSPSTTRYQRFLSRALWMVLRFGNKEVKVDPDHWRDLVVPEVELPKSGETLALDVSLWDRAWDGTPRKYPAFAGSKKLNSLEVTRARGEPVVIRLQANVSADEY